MMNMPYLDHEVKVTNVGVGAGGGVGTHDLLASNLCRDRDVLTNGKSKDVLLVRQTKAVTRGTRSAWGRSVDKRSGGLTERCWVTGRPFRSKGSLSDLGVKHWLPDLW